MIDDCVPSHDASHIKAEDVEVRDARSHKSYSKAAKLVNDVCEHKARTYCTSRRWKPPKVFSVGASKLMTRHRHRRLRNKSAWYRLHIRTRLLELYLKLKGFDLRNCPLLICSPPDRNRLVIRLPRDSENLAPSIPRVASSHAVAALANEL